MPPEEGTQPLTSRVAIVTGSSVLVDGGWIADGGWAGMSPSSTIGMR